MSRQEDQTIQRPVDFFAHLLLGAMIQIGGYEGDDSARELSITARVARIEALLDEGSFEKLYGFTPKTIVEAQIRRRKDLNARREQAEKTGGIQALLRDSHNRNLVEQIVDLQADLLDRSLFYLEEALSTEKRLATNDRWRLNGAAVGAVLAARYAAAVHTEIREAQLQLIGLEKLVDSDTFQRLQVGLLTVGPNLDLRRADNLASTCGHDVPNPRSRSMKVVVPNDYQLGSGSTIQGTELLITGLYGASANWVEQLTETAKDTPLEEWRENPLEAWRKKPLPPGPDFGI